LEETNIAPFERKQFGKQKVQKPNICNYTSKENPYSLTSHLFQRIIGLKEKMRIY